MVESSKSAAGQRGPDAGRRVDVVASIKAAGWNTLVACGLAIPLIAIYTVTQGGQLVLQSRWGTALLFVAVVFVLRLLWGLLGDSGIFGATLNALGGAMGGSTRTVLGKLVPLLLLAVALLWPVLLSGQRYWIDIATLVLIYIMLGWGLNIVVGLAGLLDLGYVAFYAVGAYSYALLAYYYGFSFWMCLPIAGAFAAAFGITLGFPVLRLRGDYLAIVTLGFGEIIRVVLLNWVELTRGPDGITDVPRPTFFGMVFSRRPREGEIAFHEYFGLEHSSMHRVVFLYYIILLLALLTNVFIRRVRKLPLGRVWEALREDEIACRSLGIDPTRTKLSAFAIGAMFGGFAGSFFAARQGFISPESFSFIESAIILAIVVLGGMGSQIGVVIAAIVVIGGTEIFRELEEFRMLFFGAAMVLIMVWRPEGLLSRRDPTIRLHGGGAAGGATSTGTGQGGGQ